MLNQLQKTGIALLVVTLIIVLVVYSIPEIKYFDYLKMSYRIIGSIGALLLVPWKGLPTIIFDNHEFSPNKKIRKLVKKIRFRALLLKNISVIILILSIASIITGFYILLKPSNGLSDILNDKTLLANDALLREIMWNSISVRFAVIFLLIFLIQILFRVFRYLLRLSAYYDGIADSIEICIIEEKLDLSKIIELFTPKEYDIRELKQTSVPDSLASLLKK